MSHPNSSRPNSVAVRIAFAVHRRGRPRRLLIILIGGRLVLAVRPAPVPNAAIAPRVRPRRIIAVVTAIAPVTIAPLDIFAFDVATLVDKARSRDRAAAPVTAAGGAAIVVAGRVAIARRVAAAAIGTGIAAVIAIVIVAGLRRRRGRQRTEQCEDACYDQYQSAASWRAGGSRIVHCNLRHPSVWSNHSRGENSDQSATGCARNEAGQVAVAS